jgi:hypothetical protein
VLQGAEEERGDGSISYIGCELAHDSDTVLLGIQ